MLLECDIGLFVVVQRFGRGTKPEAVRLQQKNTGAEWKRLHIIAKPLSPLFILTWTQVHQPLASSVFFFFFNISFNIHLTAVRHSSSSR